jgi:diguanylate cyclase (GGDEF)-like protein/PAS domain S-box-containing protein
VHVSRIVAVAVAAVLLVVTGVAAMVGFAYDARQRAVARTDVRRAALRSLTTELDTLVVSTRQVAALFAASDDVSEDEFRTFVGPMLRDGSASAYGWMPHVVDADRAAWERRTGMRISEYGRNGVEVAPSRPSYDPMLLIQTAVPVKLPRALDVAADQDNGPALSLAQAMEEPRATPVIVLKGSYVPGLLVFAPTRGGDGELLGTAVGSFRIAALTAAIEGVLPNGAAFELHQAGRRIAGRGALDRHADSWVVDIAGQRWEVLTSAAPVGRLGNGVIALLVGGLMTAFVLLTVWSLARDAGRAERKAAESEERFVRAFEHAPVGMALLDCHGTHIRANQAMAQLLGRTREGLVGLGPEHIMPAEELASSINLIKALVRGDQRYFAGDTTLLAADGRRIRAAVHMTVLDQAPGDDAAVLVHAVDVTEQRLAERRMKHLADHDPLTGLLNRRGFAAALQTQLAHTRRYGTSGALLMLDLDGFKAVNDAQGHDAGDQLLVQVAAALRSCLRETDVVARLGGDEFAVILPRETLEDAIVVADKVIERLRECRLGAAGVGLPGATASIGVAPFTGDYQSGEDVLRDADLAMYSAKGAGRDRRAVHGRQPGLV